ncbi:MAG: hypothetical protein LBG99_08100 [Propionibacteriaceae bacterium]|jgi:hypothetical protein|nr:hypothetical protein [Propionibacteriaceae bacterium]
MKRLLLAAPVVLLAVVLALGSTTTFALWSTAVSTPPLEVQRVVIGFSVSTTHETKVANSMKPLETTFGLEEADMMLTTGPNDQGVFTVAVPLSVSMTTSGGCGIDYKVTPSNPDPASVLGHGGIPPIIFPVSTPQECTIEAAKGANLHSGGVVAGIGHGQPVQDTRTDHWCIVYQAKGQNYINTATAVGRTQTGELITSPADAQSSWSAHLFPDPWVEPSTVVTTTPIFDSGCPI